MSKTDHARPPRSNKAKRAHALQRDWDLDDQWTGRAGPKPVLPKRLAIDEGLAEQAIVARLDADAPAKDCEAMEWTPYSTRLSQAAKILDLAEWEYVLLYGEDPDVVLEHLDHDPEDDTHTRWCAECAEEYAWGRYGDFEDESWGNPAEVVDEDDEPTDWTPFLPLMTIHEAHQELDEGFLIEGPSVTRPEPKDEHYVRVYEVARDLNIEASDLVKDLCLNGEHVRSHMSWVARPVAEYLHSIAPVLQESYGPRKQRPLTWAQQLTQIHERLRALDNA